MKYYKIKPDYSDEKQNYLEATHKWGLPGVSCSVCNQIWSNTGIEYPSVDISRLRIGKQLEKGWVASLEVLENLKSEIRKAFPSYVILLPGTSFGCLVGKEVGKKLGYFNDFIWNMPWTVVVKERVLDKLKSANLNLPEIIEPKINFKRQTQKIYEFEIVPIGKLLNPIYEKENDIACLGCGRVGVSMPEKIIIEKKSLPNNCDIFRLSNFTTIVLVSERFFESVKKFELKGILFEEVEIA